MSTTPNPSNSLAGADKPAKRTGPKGDFAGHRYTFLQQHLEEYYTKVQSVTTQLWWPTVYSAFWARFDWRSHTNILLSQPIDEDLFSADAIISHEGDELLSDCEKDLKAKTMKAVNAKIKNWFTNRRSQRIPKSAKAFSPLIKALVKPSGSAPRKLSIAQFFMSHKDYTEEVERAFTSEVALHNVPLNLQIDLRCKVATRIFGGKPEAVQKALEAENDAQYQIDLAAHKEQVKRSKAIMKGMPSQDSEDQDRALTNIETSVQPLLDNFERTTGHKWVLMGVKRPLPGQVEFGFSYLQSTHPTVKVKTWNNHEPENFKRQVLAHLVEYMTAIGPSTSSQSPSMPHTRSQLDGFTPIASSSSTPVTPSSSRAALSSPLTTPTLASPALSSTSTTSNVGSTPLALKPRPRPRPSPILPTPDLSSPMGSPLALELLPRMPLPSTFDAYPSLSQALNTLPSEDRELAISNVTNMSKELREQEDSKLRAEHVLSQLSEAQYQSIFTGFDSNDLSLLPIPSPQIAAQSQPQQDVGHLTSPRQSRIAYNATASVSHAPSTASPDYPDMSDHQDEGNNAIPEFEPEGNKSPSWLRSWMQTFSTFSYASEQWLQLLQNWSKLEHDYGYISPPRCFDQRMDICKALSKAKFDPTFTCDAPSNIASDFRSWWVTLNSPTRTCPDAGWLVPGAENDAIEITKLRVPGKNGWLSLLFALMVWRISIADGDTTEWEMAVVDVNWVTVRLIKSIWYTPSIEVIPTLKRTYPDAGDDEDVGRGKRSRARAINYRV